jgi:hypothetical protein
MQTERIWTSLRTMLVLLFIAVIAAGCGGGTGEEPDVAPGAAVPAVSPPDAETAQAPQRPQEIAEVRYQISGAYDEAYEESGNVMCSITGDGRFLAQSFQAGDDRWGISLDLEGTGPGAHPAALRLGPPRGHAEIWEGRQVDEPGGRAQGPVELADSGEQDGWGNPVMTVDFSFPDVTLERSGETVGVEGRFRCGVVHQSG